MATAFLTTIMEKMTIAVAVSAHRGSFT